MPTLNFLFSFLFSVLMVARVRVLGPAGLLSSEATPGCDCVVAWGVRTEDDYTRMDGWSIKEEVRVLAQRALRCEGRGVRSDPADGKLLGISMPCMGSWGSSPFHAFVREISTCAKAAVEFEALSGVKVGCRGVCLARASTFRVIQILVGLDALRKLRIGEYVCVRTTGVARGRMGVPDCSSRLLLCRDTNVCQMLWCHALFYVVSCDDACLLRGCNTLRSRVREHWAGQQEHGWSNGIGGGSEGSLGSGEFLSPLSIMCHVYVPSPSIRSS